MPFKNQHPLYDTWSSMKSRCYTKSTKQFADYGGRGITVCDRWLEPNNQGFQNFVHDMGNKPHGFTLDRINNNLGYSPDNCRWASRTQQQRNRSVTRKVLIDGTEYLAVELAQAAGLKTDTVVKRASLGLSLLEVISKEKRKTAALLKKAKTHCPQGHSYKELGTYTPLGHRYCMECKRIKQRVINKKNSELAKLAKSKNICS